MGATVPLDNMPEIVRDLHERLLNDTGVAATVERNGYGRILFTHQSDRVRATVDFRLTGRTWRWADSKLFIDGVRTRNAEDPGMYVSIFKDPDHGRRNHVPEGAEKARLPEAEPVDEGELPVDVAAFFKSLVRENTKDGVTIEPTRSVDRTQYLIEIRNTEKGSALIFSFERGEGVPGWTLSDQMAVSALGYDITPYLDQGMDEYLMDTLGAHSRDRQVSLIPRGRTEGAAATNSTMVRKATVVRV